VNVSRSVADRRYWVCLTFGGQKLGLGCGILGVYKTSGMHLDLVHVDTLGADGHQDLVSITSGVRAIGGGKVKGVWPVLLQKRVLCEISSIATGRKDDWAFHGDFLAIKDVCDTSSNIALGVDLGDLGLLDELDTLWLGLGQFLVSLHQSVGDGHSGELGIVTTVGSGEGVSTIAS
jgi:hypothetical protein